ncbi:MAG TPA: hypothetical protein DEH00_07940 [Candidatus Marinimicrobia bacterium]|nr:hypothetical protein [Candidatus Neomarinimicrobiota bacterium]
MNTEMIYEQDLSQDKELEKSLRKSINAWAKTIPNHPYKNLGDQISVESILYKPAYPMRLLTQYENRRKDKGHEPYTNQTIPERKIYALNDFNSWDISLPDIQKFTDKTTKYYVQGSQYVADCFHCHARGVVTCPQCNGLHQVTCPSCQGAGKVRCTSCGGSGRYTCSNCGGSGQVSRQVSRQRSVTRYDSDGNSHVGTETYYETVRQACSVCSGRGYRTCSTCGGTGKVTCRQCRGTGKITCPRCSGQGIVTCYTCQGHKQLMHYFFVERTLNYTDQNTCIVHENIYKQFPEYLDHYQEYKSYNVVSQTEDLFQPGVLPEGHHLNSFIDAFITESREKNSDSHVIKFQRLDIDCIDTWELTYTFRGKEYVMAFTGSEYTVIPGLSPIYEVAFKDWKSGVRAGRLLWTTRAYHRLKKASSIDVYEIREKVNTAFGAVNEKIKDHYTVGVRIAGLLALFFGSFIAYGWFKHINPVFSYASFINRPENFLHAYHAWAQVFLFIFLGTGAMGMAASISKKFKTAIPQALLRIIFGGLITLIAIAIALGILGLLNITGITILADIALLIVHWIFKIVLILLGIFVGIVVWGAKIIWMLLSKIWNWIF